MQSVDDEGCGGMRTAQSPGPSSGMTVLHPPTGGWGSHTAPTKSGTQGTQDGQGGSAGD